MKQDPLPATFEEFWELYLSEHGNSVNRWMHTIGTAGSLAVLSVCLIFAFYWGLLAVPLVGYGFAWSGHAFVEKNRPLSLRAPVRSLLCDYRMAMLMISRRSLTGREKTEFVGRC